MESPIKIGHIKRYFHFLALLSTPSFAWDLEVYEHLDNLK